MSLSEEAKAKLSAAHLANSHTLETQLLMSETRKGINNPMFGKITSNETKPLLSSLFISYLYSIILSYLNTILYYLSITIPFLLSFFLYLLL